MVQEALRYAAAQAAGLPGVASKLEKDSFLTPLLAGDAAPFVLEGKSASWPPCYSPVLARIFTYHHHQLSAHQCSSFFVQQTLVKANT